MKATKKLRALGAFFVVALVLAGCGSGVPGDSVADMSGNPVTVQAFNHWMFVAAKQSQGQTGASVIVPNDPPSFKTCIANVRKAYPQFAKQSDKLLKSECSQLFTSLSTQVMDFLIRSYWYQADAAREHVSVSDASVQKAFELAKRSSFPTNAQFQAYLTQTGQTLADILYRFRINQLVNKLVQRVTQKVTPAEIQAYYNSHLAQYGTPVSRNIHIVLASTQARAAAAKAALAHGQSWSVVAKKYSIDPTTRNNGGLLVNVTKGQQDAALNAAAFAAPQGQLLGPVKGQFGYYVFEVASIRPATQQSVTQVTPLIRSTLQQQNANSALTAVQNAAKKRWLGKTTCRAQYAMADCKGFKPHASGTSTGVG
jgi:foldase protein PrsA